MKLPHLGEQSSFISFIFLGFVAEQLMENHGYLLEMVAICCHLSSPGRYLREDLHQGFILFSGPLLGLPLPLGCKMDVKVKKK
jgi:hypothetical protein